MNASATASETRVPCSANLRRRIRSLGRGIGKSVVEALGEHLPSSAQEFAALERKLAEIGVARLIGPALELVLATVHANEQFVAESIERAAEARPLTVNSYRDVAVCLVNGSVALVPRTPYAMNPKPPASRPGRRRGVGRRGPSGSGCYPVLARLGFLGRTSPVMTSTVARAAAELGSYAEARDSLSARGVGIDLKAVRLIAHRVADAGIEARRALAEAEETRTLEGKRVVVAFDGGRLRTRVSGKRGRRRKKTGRRSYKTPWREPALLAIYTVDENGKKTSERPWYEATLGGWDQAFAIATSLLRYLGAKHAREFVIAGDGATNIWDRVDALVAALGIDKSRLRLFVDFWHAVEHLHDTAELVRHWTPEQRVRWVRARRRELHDGHCDRVVAAMRELAVGRNAAEIGGEADYFETRAARMKYAELREAHLPIGTGAVESAVRRVVNLRMKGPGIFWEDENAERMLLLRCRQKAGRWDELERDFCARAAAPHGRVLKNARRSGAT